MAWQRNDLNRPHLSYGFLRPSLHGCRRYPPQAQRGLLRHRHHRRQRRLQVSARRDKALGRLRRDHHLEQTPRRVWERRGQSPLDILGRYFRLSDRGAGSPYNVAIHAKPYRLCTDSLERGRRCRKGHGSEYHQVKNNRFYYERLLGRAHRRLGLDIEADLRISARRLRYPLYGGSYRNRYFGRGRDPDGTGRRRHPVRRSQVWAGRDLPRIAVAHSRAHYHRHYRGDARGTHRGIKGQSQGHSLTEVYRLENDHVFASTRGRDQEVWRSSRDRQCEPGDRFGRGDKHRRAG